MADLRGATLPEPTYRTVPLSADMASLDGYKSLQTYFPTLTDLYKLPKRAVANFYFDTRERIVGVKFMEKVGNGACRIQVVANDARDASGVVAPTPTPTPIIRDAYVKITHLLDPVRWMHGKYSLPKESGLPAPTRSWSAALKKLQDPWNQAYIEVLASYALGKLHDSGASPHFNSFYGSFCSIADTYRYNVSDDLESFRNEGWFWSGAKKGLYDIHVESDGVSVGTMTRDAFLDNPGLDSEYDSDLDSETTGLSDDESGTDSISVLEVDEVGVDAASLHSDSLSEMETVASDSESIADSNETESTEEPEFKTYASLKNFPVMLLFMEKSENTMDSLMDEEGDSGSETATGGSAPLDEAKWIAWLFQVIAALCQIQSLFGFTHNDLHTNNVVYVATSEEFLYYKTKGGYWKVPTYGKIFRIIDFGRSIFRLNGRYFISDDFRDGNEASDQYCFEPLVEDPDPEEIVPPNPSFDLCRLAVSLFEGLFPKPPPPKDDGRILSNEDGMQIIETTSDLCNMLWEWMIDDDGKNIFINPDGSERYPDFYLYRHIAAHIHNAIPIKQLERPLFAGFRLDAAPEGQTVYPLFC